MSRSLFISLNPSPIFKQYVSMNKKHGKLSSYVRFESSMGNILGVTCLVKVKTWRKISAGIFISSYVFEEALISRRIKLNFSASNNCIIIL